MEYFKSCFRKVDLNILDEYKKEYQGSEKEENDVKAAYLAVCHSIPVTAMFVLDTLIRLISTVVVNLCRILTSSAGALSAVAIWTE